MEETGNPYRPPRCPPDPPSYTAIWVSSIEHVTVFQQSYQRTSFLRRHVFGAYEVPEGFPFLRSLLGLPWRVPVVFYAHGELDIRPNELLFRSTPLKLPMNRVHNVDPNLAFAVDASEIVSVEPYEFKSPVAGFFDITFAHVRTSRTDSRLSNILLSVVMKVPGMKTLRLRNRELLDTVAHNFR